MPSLTWYWRRLQTMSLGEMVRMRAWRAFRDRFVPIRDPVPPGLSLALVPLDDTFVTIHTKHFLAAQDALCSTGEKILQGYISFFGDTYTFGSPFEWNQDPESGRPWPMRPTHRLNYRSLEGGDPKYVWELNRQQFLLPLAQAYAITGDERFAEAVVQHILSWIEQCPVRMGVNWTSGIELAIRQITWLACLDLIGKSPAVSQAQLRIATSMYQQSAQIRRNLSLYSSANNHLIAELTTLVLVGTQLKNTEWVKTGRRLLIEHLPAQILPDGVGAEQSPSYQLHSMEFYVLAGLSLKRMKQPFPSSTLERLQKGALFLQAIADAKGAPPAFGDNDSGHILPLSTTYSAYKSLANAVAYLCADARVLYSDWTEDDKLFWLLGVKEYEAFRLDNEQKPKTPKHADAYTDGGYYILRDAVAEHDVKVVFDAAALGMPPLAGHGHADALSFVLMLDGQQILIDPGTYTYFGDERWRNYFRGTAAHNTIRVDARDQSIFGGRFLATHQARSKCLSFTPGAEICAEHDGYTNLADPVVHRRLMRIDKEAQALHIEDKLLCKGAHQVEICFHIAPGILVNADGKSAFEIKSEAHRVRLSLPEHSNAQIYSGNETGPWGFQSTTYGQKEACTSIVGTLQIQGPETLKSSVQFV